MFNKERLLNFKKYLILKAANGTILDNMIGAIEDPYKVTNTTTPKVEDIKFTDPELINHTESTTSTTTTTVDPEDVRQSMLASRRRGASSATSTPAASTTPASYTASNSETRSSIISKIKQLRPDISDDLAEALAIQIGAESGYNSKALNGSSTAYGYGQLIAANQANEMLARKNALLSENARKALENKGNVVDETGRVLFTLKDARDEASRLYKSLSDDDQLDLVLNHYYDRNKDKLNGKTRDGAARYLAIYGLAPAIALKGSVNIDGVTYTDSDEDLYKYLLKYHPYIKDKLHSWQDHMDARYRSAGYSRV